VRGDRMFSILLAHCASARRAIEVKLAGRIATGAPLRRTLGPGGWMRRGSASTRSHASRYAGRERRGRLELR
jgi:hypothetical protein